MNQVLGINNPRPDNQIPLLLEERETRSDIHPPTLSEIQRRACKIHYERVVSGGYTLDDWLEAEHELERKLTPSSKKDQVH
jgi:hypothetical protein